MKRIVALTLIAGALIGTSTAEAHVLRHRPFKAIKNEKTRLLQTKQHLERTIQHDKSVIRWWRARGGWYILNSANTLVGAESLRFHEKQLGNARRTLTGINNRLAILSRPPHYNEWLCIHRYEGAWNDPNPPYYGGLQMDYDFMRTYGTELLRTKGTADKWTPLEQMWVAERAYASGRGFYPWPNTARYCGLI